MGLEEAYKTNWVQLPPNALHRLEKGGKREWCNFVQEIEEALTAMYKLSFTMVEAGLIGGRSENLTMLLKS